MGKVVKHNKLYHTLYYTHNGDASTQDSMIMLDKKKSAMSILHISCETEKNTTETSNSLCEVYEGSSRSPP